MSFFGTKSLRTALLTALLFGFGTAWAASQTLALIDVGAEAPPLAVEGKMGTVHLVDGATTEPLLLLFLKPEDRYASQTVDALDDLFRRFPMIASGHRSAVIVSRYTDENRPTIPESMGDGWPVYLDRDDKAYHAYNIIATPSIIIVDGEGTVAAVQPGYDHSMPEWLLKSLAEVQGVELPEGAAGAPDKPNMALQMGRRLAMRGLWDRALPYYAKAAGEQPLSPKALIELAEIHLELGQKQEALAILDALPQPEKESERAAELRTRAMKGESNPEELGAPPKVNR